MKYYILSLLAIVAAGNGRALAQTSKFSPAAVAAGLTTDAAAGGLSFTSPTSTSATVGMAFTFTLTVSGLSPVAPASFAAVGLPGGLTLDSGKGTIDGTPTIAGMFAVMLTVTNGNASATATLTITVAPAPVAPVITKVGAGVLTVSNQPFTYTITATGSPTGFSAIGLPSGLVLNPTTGVISGTPTIAGVFVVALSATNSTGTGNGTLTLTIALAVSVLTSPNTASAFVGTSFTYNITFGGTSAPPGLNVTGLPPGLIFNKLTGTITGAPLSAGGYTATINWGDGTSIAIGSSILTLTVAPAGIVPVLTSSPTAVAAVGMPFTYTITATGSPMAFGATGLPPGLVLNPTTGVISGTPTTAGVFVAALSASITTTGGGLTSAGSLTISVAPAGGLPVLTSSPTAVATVGMPFTYTITATGSPTGFGATGLPPGLTYNALTDGLLINRLTGVISGTPTTAGVFVVTLSASNTYTGGASINAGTLTITVSPPGVPVFTGPTTATATVGMAFTHTIVAVYMGDANLTYSASGLPEGLVLNPMTGEITGTPKVAGMFVVTLTATSSDASGNLVKMGTGQLILTTSAAASVTPLVVNVQPASQTATFGLPVTFTATITFTATVTPTTPLMYQWYFNGKVINGATSSTFTIPSPAIFDSGSYTVAVNTYTGLTNVSAGLVKTGGGILALTGAGSPAIATQPQGHTMATGSTVVLALQSGTVTFNSAGGGTPRALAAASAASYQWYLNGVAVTGATNSTLVLQNLTPADAGSYACLVSNSSGSTLSNPAVLAVTATSNPGRLVNLSVLTAVPFTVGFNTGGAGTSSTQSQTLLIRATGPALAAFGQTGLSTDPLLTVIKQGGPTVASNDNWGTPLANQNAITAADILTQAFTLGNPASLDAAVIAALPASGYSVQITGPAGLALAEIYDATPGTYAPDSPRLTNLSALTQVKAGASLSAGFVLGGNTSKTVLIRAVGPGLAGLGVSGGMPDPQLVFHAQTNGVDSIIATNAGWGNDPVLINISNAVFAFGITPGSHDAVIAMTLQPGVGYSAVASSSTNAAGSVIIEVYEVP